jgi:hypothetical protein
MRASKSTVATIRLLLCAGVVGSLPLGCTAPLDSFSGDGGIGPPDAYAADAGNSADGSAPADAGGTNGPLCEGYDEVLCPGGTPCALCPVSDHCYDGICTLSLPACLDPTHPDYLGWPDDTDLEPNGLFELATVLPCGDDGVAVNPGEYITRCPSRASYTNGFMNLVICPEGERDLYGLYLLDGETVVFDVLYQYSASLPRDLDVRVWTFDDGNQQWRGDVAVGLSTNDNEQVSFSTGGGSGNPGGWYYLEVAGKTPSDVNFYTVSFTLNP